MSATLRTLALAVLLLMALVSPLASGATPFHLIRNSHIFVSPEGIDGEMCGQEKQPCRTLHAAVALAAPYTRIIVSNGTYDCGLHITVPVSISGVENGVYLRCGGTKRGIWFDGVPAQIEGVHIEDGYGEGAGGILVTQHSEHVLYTNYISHCSFRACVGTPSSVVKGVAGAVLISYTKARYPRPYFIEASRFEGNYARGDVAPAGAVAIHLPVANETPNEKCKVFSIDRSESNDPNVGTYAGVYRAVEGLSISGTTVYNSLGRKPTAADGTEEVKWVALCPQNNLYGFFTTVGVPARSFDGCDNDISGMVHMDGVPLFENEWWLAKHTLSRAFLHLRCQDDAMAPKKCDHFYPVNMPGPQSSRQALFTVIPDLVIAQRPTFVSVDVEDPHWVWYCDSLKEWIFTDTDPHSLIDGVPEQCRRGVASGPTHAMHPLMVDTWKFWNNATNQWATAPLRRSGGMHIVCISPDELPCNTVQLVNANNEASVFQGDLHPPTLQFPRAVYTSYHTQPPQYMAFCAKFNEWMITNDDPRLDETTSEVCERALSSSRTTAPTPEEAGRWFVFGQTVSNAWQASTMEAMCVTGCHSITISSVVDQACPACGDYVAGGLHSGFRFYRQVNGLASHVIFRSTDHPWVVTPAVNMRVGATRDDVLLTALIVGDTTDDLMNSRRWHGGSASAGNSVYKHLLVECAAVHNCSSFDVRHSTHSTFNGVFERGSVIMGRRPTYQNRRQTALMYFDDVESRWIVKHRDSPDLRLASRRTRSVTPGSTTVWSLEGKRKKSKSSSATNANADIEEWTYAEVKSRLVVVCEGTEATRSAASSSAPLRSTDMIAHSVFTGNVALSNAMDGVPVAGAVMIKYEWLPTGFTTRGQVRDVTMLGNEAIMPFKAGRIDSTGALTVRNPSRLMNYIALQDVTAANNVGDWGGAVSFTGSTVSLTRVTLRHNQATRSGGAIAGRISHINATMLTCSHNNARMQGGCADLDRSTRLYIGRSELVNNSAGLSGGTVASQGYVYVHGTKVDKMVSMAFTGAVLHLVDSSLFCASGRAMTYIGGFGCQPDADPTPASPSLAIAAVDSDEAWWINVASTTSQIAQVMLTITMVVFVIQYFITNRSPATPGSHRSSLAARWHATQGKDAAAKDTKKSS